MPWTRITDPDYAAELLPTWFSGRMIGEREAFGLLLTTGDVVRITSIMALATSIGLTFLDVLLDSAGVPVGVDLAWSQKHFLSVPVPGATLATVNVAHVIALVEFVAAELVESPGDISVPRPTVKDLFRLSWRGSGLSRFRLLCRDSWRPRPCLTGSVSTRAGSSSFRA